MTRSDTNAVRLPVLRQRGGRTTVRVLCHVLMTSTRHGVAAKEIERQLSVTYTLESHWSLFKRAVKGTHVHIRAKHS